MSEETITIPKEQLDTLLKQNEEMKKDLKQFRTCIMKFCGVLGLTNKECTDIRPEIKSGEEGVMGAIIGEAGGILALFSQVSLPIIGKKAEQKINEKFSFFGEAVPLIDKYGKQQ